MRYRIASVGIVFSLLAMVCHAEPSAQCRANGQQSLAAFTHGNYDQAVQHFAPDVAVTLTPERMKGMWAQLQSVAGDFRQMGDLQASTLHGVDVYIAPLTFTQVNLQGIIGCDAQNRISKFRIIPAGASDTASSQTPPSSATGIARAVSISSPLGPLPGTLVLPKGKGPFPAVVMIVGSGALDRDETIGPNKPFVDIADGLAAAGVASLRYDKRTYAYAAQMMGKDVTVDEEVTDDAITALRLLAQQPSIDPKHVFLLGHSLGAFMAPRIGERDKQVAGIILMAAPTSFGLDTIIKQNRYQARLRGMSAAEIDRRLAPLIQQRDLLAHADQAHPPAGSFFHAPASYWLSVRDYDPVATAKRTNEPMLIVQGGSDIQVFPREDFVAWQSAFAHDPRVKLIEYPGLSHLFMPASDPPSPADYDKPAHVDSKVIENIANWIKTVSAHS